MATLQRGTTVTPATTVTAQTLHTLIENATIGSLTGADVAGGLFFLAATNATPSPSMAPFWFDPSHRDPIFRVFARPWNIWLAAGPDRFEIPLLNSGPTDALKGAMVIASGASNFAMATGCTLNVIGFLQSRTAVGAWGPVATMGIGFALYCSSASYASPLPNAETDLVGIKGVRLGGAAADKSAANPNTLTATVFGKWLEGDNPSSSGTVIEKLVQIFGPRITSGF